jgi:23S rRNA (uridine2552-2'-O)-methyltransferase
VKYERKDALYRKAKAQGLRARSAFKLAELDDRFHLLRPGDRVVDVGAWPGGWLQVALERVGRRGRVVGIDLSPIEPIPGASLDVIAGDVADESTLAAALERLGRPADVLLSDAAPKLTGVRDVDEARTSRVVAAVLAAVPTLLRPGGRALVKLFMGSAYAETIARVRTLFDDVTTTRPDASRRGSAELYVVGTGRR